MSAYTDKVTEIKTYGANTLQSMADCMSPDSLESVGAQFLTRVRDDVLERVEDIDPEDFARETDDMTWEVADSAVPVYTYTKWQTFVDLGAWQEDVSDMMGDRGETMGELDHVGSLALYIIAERLAQAIRIELMDAIDEDDA